MSRAASASAAVALVGVVWVILHLAWYPHGQITDYGVYQSYGDAIVKTHAVPYRDFTVDYPPASLPMFVVPSLVGGDYHHVFQALVFLCDVGLVLGVLVLAGRTAAALAAIAPLLVGSVVLSRFDLWPAMLAVLALAALVRGRLTTSAVVLATAFAAKLWPVVLAPLCVVWIWRRDGRRSALEWLGTACAVAAAWFVPFAALSPGGVAHSFHQQLARPLQFESLGSALLLVVGDVHRIDSYGSQNVAGPGAQLLAVATSVCALLLLLVVTVRFWRGEPTDERLAIASAAAVAALVAFGKVLSPQYLIWLIPFVPLVRLPAARLLFGAALVLTQVYFPRRYWDLVAQRGTEVVVLLARDLVLVALVGALLYALQAATAASSSRASLAVN